MQSLLFHNIHIPSPSPSPSPCSFFAIFVWFEKLQQVPGASARGESGKERRVRWALDSRQEHISESHRVGL